MLQFLFALTSVVALVQGSPFWQNPSGDQLLIVPQHPLMATATMAKRPFSPLDMVQLDRLSSLNVSPDGKNAVFTRWHYNVENNKNSRSLWLLTFVDGDKDRVKSITDAVEGVSDNEPVWVGNDEIVFLRSDPNRHKSPQLYRAQLNDNGSSVQEMFPDHPLPIDIGNMKYSLEGKFLTFTAEVFANAKSSLTDTAEHDAKSAKDFSSALVFDKTYFRHWDTYDNHKNSHVFALDLSKTKDPATSAVNVLPHLRQFSCPVPPHGDSHHYAISPDGKEIAFASMGDFDKNFQAWSTNTNIYIVPTDILHSGRSSMPKCLSCKNKGANSIPLYAPNGNYLAWLEMRTPQYEADKNRLIIYDRRTGTKKDLTANWDRSVDGYIWSEDCATIYASVGEHGRTKIFAIDVATGSYKPLVSENSNSGLALVPGTNLIVFSKNSLSYPTEFYTVNGQSGEVKRRSFIHQDYMSAIKTSEVQDFWFEGAKKDQVMGWFLKPNDFKEGKKYPLAFIIHGGPQSAWMDSFSTRWNLQAYAGAGFAVAVVNFHGSNTYGQAFTDSINKNWGSYPFEDLMKGLDVVLKRYPFIDPKRVAGLGASYGGYMINWVNGHTDRFACLVNHDGLFDLRSMYYTTEELYFPEYEFGGTPFKQPEMYEKWSPSSYVKNWKTPTLVIHGGKDYRVPQGEGFSTFTALQRLGVESRLVFFPDENHWVLKPANSLRWHDEVLTWIRKFTAE